jgi:hypothetical protein
VRIGVSVTVALRTDGALEVAARSFRAILKFRGNPDKRAYAYLLTPEGMARKAQLTASFLQRKLAEYDSLKAQIAELREELESDSSR